MKNKKLMGVLIFLIAVFVITAIAFMFKDVLFKNSSGIRNDDSTVMPEATGTCNEIKSGIIVEQDFICSTDSIGKVGIVFSRLSAIGGIPMKLELLENETILGEVTVDSGEILDQHRTYITPAGVLDGMKNKKLTIRITPMKQEDTGLVIMMNKNADASFRFGNKTIKGTLCFSISE